MKKFAYLLVILVSTFTLAACNNEQSNDAEVYTTIVDQAGREIVFEKKADKLITSYYISTSAVLALDLDDSLVAIENQSNHRPLYKLAAPSLLDKPGIGTARAFDIEKTMSLEPNLVILPLKLLDSANTLSELGINVICVNPESQKLLIEMLNIIAQATGKEEVAQKLTTRISASLSELQNTLKDAEAPNVYFAGNSDLLSTAGQKMYQHTLITNANAKNASEGIDDTYWASISYEQLISYNPEYIIIAPAAPYSVEDVLNNPNIQELDCIKNKQVYKMSNAIEAWDSPIPSSYLGTLWIASVIHPDLYSTENFQNEVKYFYKEFYNFDVNIAELK